MARASEEAEWGRLSNLIAWIHNVNIWDTEKTKPINPSDINPFTRGRDKEPDDGFAKAKELAARAGYGQQ